MYYLIFIILSIFSFLEIFGKNKNDKGFLIIFLVLASVLMLRYGQGTDYFGYKLVYDFFGFNLDEIIKNFISSPNIKREILFDLSIYLFKTLKLSYEVFVGVLSLFMMRCLYKFIMKFSKYKYITLFIFYTTYWLYFDSGIRQGIAISILLGYTTFYILENKNFKALISILIASLFHTSIIIFLPILLIGKRKVFNTKVVIILSIVSFTLAYTKIPIMLSTLLPGNIEYRLSYYIIDTSGNILALMNRTLVFILITVMNKFIKKEIKQSPKDLFLNIFFVGFILYCLLFNQPLLAGRIGTYFRIFEIIIIPNLFYEIKQINLDRKKMSTNNLKYRALIFCFVFFFAFNIIWYKNIKSWLVQGSYINQSIMGYEYVSVFNKERINQIRTRGL
ncbi:EpsG family protein [Clostridium algidicarnis]|uniref:EpsG family protein n=1 Tax=Clostridium algidicarnis TaxID=37659 RepID=UPI001C0E16B1|nr:EpsG family protein [Clostridium algidicarnis]MBU3207628.1 EpsG family protein [Clostridium algidicarnis]